MVLGTPLRPRSLGLLDPAQCHGNRPACAPGLQVIPPKIESQTSHSHMGIPNGRRDDLRLRRPSKELPTTRVIPTLGLRTSPSDRVGVGIPSIVRGRGRLSGDLHVVVSQRPAQRTPRHRDHGPVPTLRSQLQKGSCASWRTESSSSSPSRSGHPSTPRRSRNHRRRDPTSNLPVLLLGRRRRFLQLAW